MSSVMGVDIDREAMVCDRLYGVEDGARSCGNWFVSTVSASERRFSFMHMRSDHIQDYRLRKNLP